uniref:AMP-binding protein n=1 Tax=Agreia sp. TaxID=1872416 RepID=UPI0035BC3220
MTRPLDIVVANDASAVLPRLREALSQGGAAILPRIDEQRSADARPQPRHAALAPGESPTVRDEPLPDRVAQNIALVIETSGSSGSPKRVALSTGALLASAASVESELGGSGQWLLSLPANYIAGVQVLVRSIVGGTTPIVQPPGHFSARVFAQL